VFNYRNNADCTSAPEACFALTYEPMWPICRAASCLSLFLRFLLWFEEHVEGIRSWPANDHMKNIPPGNTDVTSYCRLNSQASVSFVDMNTSLLTLSGLSNAVIINTNYSLWAECRVIYCQIGWHITYCFLKSKGPFLT